MNVTPIRIQTMKWVWKHMSSATESVVKLRNVTITFFPEKWAYYIMHVLKSIQQR